MSISPQVQNGHLGVFDESRSDTLGENVVALTRERRPYRLVLKLPVEAKIQLEQLLERTNSSSYTEVFGQALTLYAVVTKAMEANSDLELSLFDKKTGNVTSVLSSKDDPQR